MAGKKKVKKSVKSEEELPKTLHVNEVLEIDQLNHKIALLKEETKVKKLQIDTQSLKKKLFEQEVLLQANNLEKANQELRDHGDKVMESEQALKRLRDRLCEKYGVSSIAYDPDTFELK